MTCECCVKDKVIRIPFPEEAAKKSNSILELIHTDVCWPMQTPTPGNKRYILTITDDFSRYTRVYFMGHKNETATYIQQFVEMIKTQHQKRPKVIRSDRSREYVNHSLRSYLKREEVRIQYTTSTPRNKTALQSVKIDRFSKWHGACCLMQTWKKGTGKRR